MGLNHDYALQDDPIRNAWDYSVVLDLNVNIPDKNADVESVDGGPEIEQRIRQIRDVTRKALLI